MARLTASTGVEAPGRDLDPPRDCQDSTLAEDCSSAGCSGIVLEACPCGAAKGEDIEMRLIHART